MDYKWRLIINEFQCQHVISLFILVHINLKWMKNTYTQTNKPAAI